jgi:hypothetical protein
VASAGINIAGMKRRHDKMRQLSHDANKALAENRARAVALKILELSANIHDTGRFKRSWEMVANDFGAAVPLTALRPSKAAGKFRPILEKQADFAAGRRRFWLEVVRNIQARLASTDAENKTAISVDRERLSRARRQLDRWGNYEDAALEQIEAIDSLPTDASALLISGRKTKSASARGRLATLRTKVYGGIGDSFAAAGGWIARGRSLEPHAIFVERGFLRYSIGSEPGSGTANMIPGRRVVMRALRALKIRQVPRRVYLDVMKRAAPQ